MYLFFVPLAVRPSLSKGKLGTENLDSDLRAGCVNTNETGTGDSVESSSGKKEKKRKKKGITAST